jgi:hypothetical protein
MLPVVVHLGGQVNEFVVFVANPECVNITLPNEHPVKIYHPLGHWCSPSRTVVSVLHPRHNGIVAFQPDVPKSAPTAVPNLYVWKLI